MNDDAQDDGEASESTKHLLLQIDILAAAAIAARWERSSFLLASKMLYERNYELLAKRKFPPLEGVEAPLEE